MNDRGNCKTIVFWLLRAKITRAQQQGSKAVLTVYIIHLRRIPKLGTI